MFEEGAEQTVRFEYEEGKRKFFEADYTAALEIFQGLLGREATPNHGMWVARCHFALGDFDSIRIPAWVVEDGRLPDNWLLMGIFAAAVGKDKDEVDRLLTLSDKVARSKRLDVFFEAVGYQAETQANRQAVKVVRRYVAKAKFAKLLRI